MSAVAIEEHPTDIEVGYWWACQHPERPAEGFTAWLWECDPCMIAMAAYVAQYPEGPGTTWNETAEHARRRGDRQDGGGDVHG